VLQHLELGERHPELLAQPGIVAGHSIELVHGADRLGAECCNGVIYSVLEPGETVAFQTDERLRADNDIVEDDLRGATPRRRWRNRGSRRPIGTYRQ
jgi:hypothetical protein